MSSVTVIITVWKRNYLEEQLSALAKQTVQPDYIWVLQNEKHINVDDIIDKYKLLFPGLAFFRSDFNLKYFGRFSIAAHAPTEYILILDDDVIPATKWLEICLATSNKYGSVVSCTGRIIAPGTFRPEGIAEDMYEYYFIGDNFNADENNYCVEDTLVDYGCNCYFFRKEWLRYFWHLWPYTFSSGEDIHLSASLKIMKAIPTVVPKQTTIAEYGNLKKFYSQDMYSSWRNNDFLSIREEVFRYLIEKKGWKPILWNRSNHLADQPVSLPGNQQT